MRTLNDTGRLAQAAKEMSNYKLSVLGLCEVRWNFYGEKKLDTGETLLFSGNENEDDPHEYGVGLLLSKQTERKLIELEPISNRIMTAFQRVTIVMCYSPTNTAEEADKDHFYAQLQSTIDKTPKRDMLILMGDLNAKGGSNNTEMAWRWQYE